MRERGRKEYHLTVVIREGNDEFWEAIGRRTGRKEVLAEVRDCLAERGFTAPDCKVAVDEILTTY